MSLKINREFADYLSASSQFRNEKMPNQGKIDWIKYNFSSHYKSLSRNGNFLDIGPGLGETLIVWKEMGIKNIYSVDISKEVADYIKKLGFNCTLVKDTIKYLRSNKEKFDFININDVLEHIPQNELFDFVKAVYYALKPKGKLLIKCPNGQSPFLGPGFYADPTHTLAFTEASLSHLFNSAGFKKYQFLAEKYPVKIGDIKGMLAKYIITPAYYWYIRMLRSATFHFSPKILTQAIIAVATKD